MSNLNKAMLIGRLGQDPETRYTASGAAITNISLATSERWRDKQTGEQQEKTEWHRLVFFGRLAEVAGEYLRKGDLIYVDGRLQTDKWEDQDGVTRYTTKIVASNLQMLSGKKEGQKQEAKSGGFRDKKPAEQSPQRELEDEFTDDDIPF